MSNSHGWESANKFQQNRMSNDPTFEIAVDTAELDRQDAEKHTLQVFAEWLIENGLDFAEMRGNQNDGPFLEIPFGTCSIIGGKLVALPTFLTAAYDVLWAVYQKSE